MQGSHFQASGPGQSHPCPFQKLQPAWHIAKAVAAKGAIDQCPLLPNIPQTTAHHAADNPRIRAICPVCLSSLRDSPDIQTSRQREGLLLCQQPGEGPEDRILLCCALHPYAVSNFHQDADRLSRYNPEDHSMLTSKLPVPPVRSSPTARRSARETLCSRATILATTRSASTTR